MKREKADMTECKDDFDIVYGWHDEQSDTFYPRERAKIVADYGKRIEHYQQKLAAPLPRHGLYTSAHAMSSLIVGMTDAVREYRLHGAVGVWKARRVMRLQESVATRGLLASD